MGNHLRNALSLTLSFESASSSLVSLFTFAFPRHFESRVFASINELLNPPPSAAPSVIPQIGKQQPLRSLQVWIKSQTGPTRGTCLSILTNLTLSLCLSERTVWKPPIHFLNNPLEEVLSFKLLGLTICHDLSWESHISMLASKASRRLGILHHAKSFLGTPELLTTKLSSAV